LYLAREGLKAKLPEDWKPAQMKTGEIIYLNLRTHEVTEEHPLDEFYRNEYQRLKHESLMGEGIDDDSEDQNNLGVI
jgi:predicted secreted protein